MGIRYFGLCLILACGGFAHGNDLGFRFKDGQCVDAAGKKGLNPGFVGPCGDQRNLDLSSKDMSGLDLSGSVFDGSDLQESSFQKSILNGASLVGSKLSGAVFERAQVHGANFKGATLLNIHFNGADLKNCDFTGTDLSGVLLSYVDLSGAHFADALLVGAVMDHALLTGADLMRANLSGANLQGANLEQTRLDKSQFDSANLIAANLKKASGESANFRGSILRGANLAGAQLKTAAFRGAKLNEADLSQSDFTNGDFREAVLRDAIVEAAVFKGVTYNPRTVLPFGSDVAGQMGMVLMKPAKLLIIWDIQDDPSVTELRSYLNNAGVDVKLSDLKADAFNGSEKLQDYTAVLHLNGAVFDRDMPAGGQAAILKFVQDGGTYVATQWTGYSTETGLLKGLRDVIFMTDPNDANGSLNFVPAPAQAGHPVLSGIFGALAVDSYFSQGGLFKFDSNPAVSLMKDLSGNDIVGVRTVGKGKSVNFAFANAYNRQSLNCFSQPAVQQLILNSINW